MRIALNIPRNNRENNRITECLECSSSTLQESDVCEHGTYPVYGANGIVSATSIIITQRVKLFILSKMALELERFLM